jgi:hypothetical protein
MKNARIGLALVLTIAATSTGAVAGYDQRYGVGLVNACVAVDAVGGNCG